MTNKGVPPKPQRDVIREVDWLAVAPWVLIFRAPAAAIGWPLVIATIGLLAFLPAGERNALDLGVAQAVLPYLATLPAAVVEPWVEGFESGFFSGILGYALRMIGWIVLGTVIVDQSAPWLAQTPRRTIATSLRRTWRHTRRSISGLLLLLLGAAPFAVVLWLFGATIASPLLEPLTTPLVGFVGVLFAVPLAILLLVAAVGAPLLVSAVVLDDADAFDAVSRAFAYVIQKPLTLAWCVAIATLAGFASGALLEVVYRSSLGLIDAFTAGADPSILRGSLNFYGTFFAKAAHSFYPAYTFVAGAAIYLVMRLRIDGQPLDEIAQRGDAA